MKKCFTVILTLVVFVSLSGWGYAWLLPKQDASGKPQERDKKAQAIVEKYLAAVPYYGEEPLSSDEAKAQWNRNVATLEKLIAVPSYFRRGSGSGLSPVERAIEITDQKQVEPFCKTTANEIWHDKFKVNGVVSREQFLDKYGKTITPDERKLFKQEPMLRKAVQQFLKEGDRVVEGGFLGSRLFFLIRWSGEQPKVAGLIEETYRPVATIKDWRARDGRTELLKQAPPNGFIDNPADWAKLWKAWRGAEALPPVDFEKQIVVVDVVNEGLPKFEAMLSEFGDMHTTGSVEREIDGQDKRGGYEILLVSREGVSSIRGKDCRKK